MKRAQQDPMFKKAWDYTLQKPSISFLGTHHTPWLFATITGLLAFCYSTWNTTVNPMIFMPPFICYNGLYIARSCLSHNKTIILALISVIPTSMVMMLFNGTCTGYFVFLYVISCFTYAVGCIESYLTELRNRLRADRSSAELIFNKAMLSQCIITALFFANMTVATACYGYYVSATPSYPTPSSMLLSGTFLVIVVSALVTIHLSVASLGYFSKIRALKAPKSVEQGELIA
uniref:ABC transporter permease n=1 Tax=Panagrellus redivivus TaxID=6233 RepID=A0A7E4V222_PANRE